MRQRERNLRILGKFSTDYVNRTTANLFRLRGPDLLTDEAIEAVAVQLVREHRLQRRMNRHNRAIYARAQQ